MVIASSCTNATLPLHAIATEVGMVSVPSQNPLIEIVSTAYAADGRLEARIRIGRTTTKRFRARAGREAALLKRYLAVGLRDFNTGGGRIAALIPRNAIAALDELCADTGSSRSRMLLGAVSRYVDGSGELRRRRYRFPAQPTRFGNKDWDDLGQIQVVVARQQAKGFSEFCRKACLKKAKFFVSEIEALIRSAEEGRNPPNDVGVDQ
jgi:hypothetical protein